MSHGGGGIGLALRRRRHDFDVFISYSRRDARWVNRLARDLKLHDIKVWIDTLDLKVGDTVRAKIEEGIEFSRYFCFVISDASLQSYYARTVELEAAFSKMIDEKSEAFILPVMLRKPSKPLPLMLRQYHYLSFTNPRRYADGVFQLAKRIKLDDEQFSGSRWYTGIDVSPLGLLVGVGPMPYKSHSGYSVEIHFAKGQAVSLEMYHDGKLYCDKKVFYEKGRVSMIEQYRKGRRTERLVYYYTRSNRPRRKLKQWFGAGDYPRMEASYDADGLRRVERYLKPDGSLDDSQGFASREFIYDRTGKVGEVVFRDSKGNIVHKERV